MENFETSINNRQQTTEALEVSLKGLGMRSKAISGNIANVSTPGYKRRSVDFEQTLMEQVSKNHNLSDIAIQKTHANHFSNKIFEISELKNSIAIESSETGDSFLNDGNNVDIDREMIELTKTGLRYKAVSKMAKKHFEGLRGIIRGG